MVRLNLVGVVTSAKMMKSITVQVPRMVEHPKYKKKYTKLTRLHAHDEHNQCSVGDQVKIEECRPISKTKAFTLVEVVKKWPEHIFPPVFRHYPTKKK